jgi:hypothetical protein
MKVFKAILTLLSIAAIGAFLDLENRLSWSFGGIALLLYFLSSAIHLLAHESGHYMGGAISGYSLLYLQLGALNIVVKNNKPTLFWKASLNGQCVMIPKSTTAVRYKAYNLGGIFTNALVVGLSFLLLLYNSFFASLLFIEIFCVGIQKVLVNAIPHKTNSIPNDAYVVSLLKRNVDVQKDYVMYLKLYGKLFLDETFLVQEFVYEREVSADENEMLYYNEIQDILHSINSTTEQTNNREETNTVISVENFY